MRYLIHNHPAFPGLLSKEDLYLLVERSSLARGDLCTDTHMGRDHTVGEVISGMRPPRASMPARIDRPAYQEFRADSPLEAEDIEESDEDEAADKDEDEDDGEHYTASGERILHLSHPSWLGYTKALFLALLLLIAAVMLFRHGEEYAIISLLCCTATLTCVAIARFSKDYLVTEERVEVVWGILGRSSKEVRICDIRSIDVYERGLKGLLGLGTLDFSSAANAGIEVRFKDMRGAHLVKEQVRRLQRGEGRDD